MAKKRSRAAAQERGGSAEDAARNVQERLPEGGLVQAFEMLVHRLDAAEDKAEKRLLADYRNRMADLADPAALGLPVAFENVQRLVIGMHGASRCAAGAGLVASSLSVCAACRHLPRWDQRQPLCSRPLAPTPSLLGRARRHVIIDIQLAPDSGARAGAQPPPLRHPQLTSGGLDLRGWLERAAAAHLEAKDPYGTADEIREQLARGRSEAEMAKADALICASLYRLAERLFKGAGIGDVDIHYAMPFLLPPHAPQLARRIRLALEFPAAVFFDEVLARCAAALGPGLGAQALEVAVLDASFMRPHFFSIDGDPLLGAWKDAAKWVEHFGTLEEECYDSLRNSDLPVWRDAYRAARRQYLALPPFVRRRLVPDCAIVFESDIICEIT